MNKIVSLYAFYILCERKTSSNSNIIALGKSWAYYMSHYLADKQYGITYSGQANEQGIGYTNNNPIYGLSSHLNLLEDFSPFRTYDPFYWIPQGLFYDLKDSRNETLPVIDQVSGYTNQQMFNAFGSSINSLTSYRTNLLQQSNNNQSSDVNYLFNQYGY